MAKTSRATRASQKGRTARTIAVTLLAGLFVALGTGVLWDLAARILPGYEEAGSILGRDTHETIMPNLATRTCMFESLYRVTLAGADGTPFVIEVSWGLYGRALPGLTAMESMSVTLQRSVLFGKPRALEIKERSVLDLSETPALRVLLRRSDDEPPSRVTTYDLGLPFVLSAGGLTMLGLMAWVIIRLPRKERFAWPLFGGGMILAAALGTAWWAV